MSAACKLRPAAWLPLLCILAAGLAGCVLRPSAEVPLQPYRHSDPGFSISLPRGWEQEHGVGGVAVGAVSPGGENRMSLAVAVERTAASSLDEYLALNLSLLEKVVDQFDLQSRERVKLGSQDAWRIVYRAQNGQGQIEVMTYFVLARGHGYAIVFGSDPESFSTNRNLFEAVAATFRLQEVS